MQCCSHHRFCQGHSPGCSQYVSKTAPEAQETIERQAPETGAVFNAASVYWDAKAFVKYVVLTLSGPSKDVWFCQCSRVVDVLDARDYQVYFTAFIARDADGGLFELNNEALRIHAEGASVR